ncbi:restriction endonuclease subunit S [Vibrio ruber]|uniref:restriction endonuclease subunit S n=1 Tax=Vibrio ruber TaxID=184755 RepID=UPI0028933DD5|nr:restriction endonuclease subunit S [Vibrio ruber]WNJ97338.1 restriction endonuclease subunit S [Vibrio ruber]
MTDKQTVKFGDICKEVKLTTKDPIGDGYERYIGLEHLDSGSLKIKRWGMIADDSPSFTRVFKKGQILFGKRRPYLKKAAIAEFDGICSGDIIVLEAKDIVEYSDILPFIIQSDVLWEWAIKTSSGSLSPRTKFNELKSCEITIPKDSSRKQSFLNLMRRVIETLSCSEEALDDAYRLYSVLGVKQFKIAKSSIPLEKLCLKIQDGTHYSPKNISDSGDFQYVTSKNIRMGRMEILKKEYISKEEHRKIYSRCDTVKGDILLTKDGANTGNICLNEVDEEISLLSSVAFIRVDPDKVARDFIYHWLMSSLMQREISSQMAGNAITRLTLKKIKAFKIPNCSLSQQEQIGYVMNEALANIELLKNKVEDLKLLKRVMVSKEIN